MNLTFHRWPHGTGEIRGQQIGDYLNAKVINGGLTHQPGTPPLPGINIWVKGEPSPRYQDCESPYLDIVDAPERMPWLSQHTDIGLIAISETALAWLTKKLPGKDIRLIPEHHCNFARELRTRTEVRNVGTIGNRSAFWGINPDIVSRFAEMGLNFTYRTEPQTLRKIPDSHTWPWMEAKPISRSDVVSFYRNVDIQVVWRDNRTYGAALRNPLKLENAGSFGIPTVAWPEIDYVAEWTGAFIPVETLEEMFAAVKRLKDDPIYYRDMAQAALERAEKYHIEYISKQYLCLT